MVIVNTVVIVRGVLGLPEDDVAMALGLLRRRLDGRGAPAAARA